MGCRAVDRFKETRKEGVLSPRPGQSPVRKPLSGALGSSTSSSLSDQFFEARLM